MYAKQHYTTALETLSNNSNMNMRLIHYKRGWFVSQATLASSLPLADKPLQNNLTNQTYALINQRIFQGPLIVNHSGIKFAFIEIDSFLVNKKIATTRLGFTGSLNTHIDLDGLLVTRKETHKPLYALKQAKGDLNLNLITKRFAANIHCQKLFSDIDHPRLISDFSTSQQAKQSSTGLWVGNNQYHFGYLNWVQGDQHFVFKNFDYNLTSQVIKKRFDVTIEGKIADAVLGNKNYGPQTISFSIKNLNEQMLQKLTDEFPLSKLHTKQPFELANAQQQILALLNDGGVIALKAADFNTSSGHVSAQANFNFNGHQDAKTFAALLGSADAQITARLPTTLAYQIMTNFYLQKMRTNDKLAAKVRVDESIKQWQNEGWLHNDGTDIIIDLKWQDKPLPLNKN